MKHIENIVIGTPLVSPSELFGRDIIDWETNECKQTYYTEERFLPRILVELGIYPSISEIRRNKPELLVTFDKPDFIQLKPKKKVPLWVLIGE